MLKIKSYHFYSILLTILFVSCNSTPKKENTKWLSLAKKTEKYILKGKDSFSYGIAWNNMPDSIKSRGDVSVYSGDSGIILFYLELYNATKDTTYLNQAKIGANTLESLIKDSITSPYFTGLYAGYSGIGFTLAETYKVTKNKKYKTAALKIVDLLEQYAEKTDHGIEWKGFNDIMYGSAGIGLYLQYISDKFDYKKADSLSVLAANGLIDNAIDTLGGYRWVFSPKLTKPMDNFSHGTAGVAYFLSETYRRTKDKKFLDASLQATKLLKIIENSKGYIPHDLPKGKDLYYHGWCHGPAGTDRLFYSLYHSTDDKKWIDKITTTADHLITDNIDKEEKPGYWNNVSRCCGTAGIAEYYAWVYEITNNEKYLNFSERLTENLLAKATHENDYMKWVQAEHRVKPEFLTAQTGLMQGNAGIGLWFLELDAIHNNKEKLIQFPDKPKVE